MSRTGFGWSWPRTSSPTSGVSMNNSPPTPRRSPHCATRRHQLRDVVGIRAVLAARLLGRTGPGVFNVVTGYGSVVGDRLSARDRDRMTRVAERVSFPSTTGPTLAGSSICPQGELRGWGVFAHGFTLGKDSPAASRICKQLASEGIGMLRFDNLGLGDSEGDWGDGSFSHKVADTVRAVEFMNESGREVRLLVGHSFGGVGRDRRRPRVPDCGGGGQYRRAVRSRPRRAQL